MKPILIKYARNLAGFSQKDLAEKVGVDHSLISKIEAGVVQMQSQTEFEILQAFKEAGIDTEIIIQISKIINRTKGV